MPPFVASDSVRMLLSTSTCITIYSPVNSHFLHFSVFKFFVSPCRLFTCKLSLFRKYGWQYQKAHKVETRVGMIEINQVQRSSLLSYTPLSRVRKIDQGYYVFFLSPASLDAMVATLIHKYDTVVTIEDNDWGGKLCT